MGRKKADNGIPRQVILYEATFRALQELNGSGTNEEIRKRVIIDLRLPDSVVDLDHDGIVTELEYDLKWARTGLKVAGVISSSDRGVWAITPEYSERKSIDGDKIRGLRTANKKKSLKQEKQGTEDEELNEETDSVEEIDQIWHKQLVQILTGMDPYGFERLSTRLLRECGFSEVQVTQQTADHGIDGYGRIQLYGLVSFNVAFQCKRQKNTVSSEQIRNFRGSLTAKYEKGLFITTGTYSNAAEKEASDTSKSPQIDLIDGEEFIQLLIAHKLGVEETKNYKIDKAFFDSI